MIDELKGGNTADIGRACHHLEVTFTNKGFITQLDLVRLTQCSRAPSQTQTLLLCPLLTTQQRRTLQNLQRTVMIFVLIRQKKFHFILNLIMIVLPFCYNVFTLFGSSIFQWAFDKKEETHQELRICAMHRFSSKCNRIAFHYADTLRADIMQHI